MTKGEFLAGKHFKSIRCSNDAPIWCRKQNPVNHLSQFVVMVGDEMKGMHIDKIYDTGYISVVPFFQNDVLWLFLPDLIVIE